MVFLDHVQNLHIRAEKTHKYFGQKAAVPAVVPVLDLVLYTRGDLVLYARGDDAWRGYIIPWRTFSRNPVFRMHMRACQPAIQVPHRS